MSALIVLNLEFYWTKTSYPSAVIYMIILQFIENQRQVDGPGIRNIIIETSLKMKLSFKGQHRILYLRITPVLNKEDKNISPDIRLYLRGTMSNPN